MKTAKLGHLVTVENTKPKLNSATHFNSVHVQQDGETFELMLTHADLHKCRDRAEKNPEDSVELIDNYNLEAKLRSDLIDAEIDIAWWTWRAKPFWIRWFTPEPTKLG